MIEIEHSLLNSDALDNLIIDIVTRQSTDYGENEVAIETKKSQLMRKLEAGDAVIIYSSEEGVCDIVSRVDFHQFQKMEDGAG